MQRFLFFATTVYYYEVQVVAVYTYTTHVYGTCGNVK